MGIGNTHYMKRGNEYTVSYTGIGGVDFTSGGVGRTRSRYAYLENMYRDYDGDGDGMVESIPGFRRILSLGKKINRIYTHTGNDSLEYAVIHAGDSLYRFPLDERDSLGTLTPIFTLSDTRSNGFTSGNDLFILDGKSLTRVGGDGIANTVKQNGHVPYVPTIYVNGAEYEQRNLLSEYVREEFYMSSPDEYMYGTESLMYKIISAEKRTCAVTGVSDLNASDIWIPPYIKLGNTDYTVTEISDSAFSGNNVITELHTSIRLEKIGARAFSDCQGLLKVYTGAGISEIGAEAFYNCPNLNIFYLGAGISSIGEYAFAMCQQLLSIKYALDSKSFLSVSGHDTNTGSKTIIYDTENYMTTVSIPVYGAEVSIDSLSSNDDYHGFSTSMMGLPYIESIRMAISDKRAFYDRKFIIIGKTDGRYVNKNSAGSNFLVGDGASVGGIEAITECRVCESFDGRIFLSGNPKIPNTVFYTSRDKTGKNNPTYFGVLNYFNDGGSAFPVRSLLTAGDSLAVFKSGDDGGGSIFYHTPKETDIDILPKIYPVSYVHSGVCATGESISFFDDPIFVSSLGITSLDKRNINLERSIAIRSHSVNSKLLTEASDRISLAKWLGYLVVLAEGNIYLADSRDMYSHPSGSIQYEWYYLTGIGTYKNDKRVFRYASSSEGGYLIKSGKIGQIPTETVKSMTDSNGILRYYTGVRTKKYGLIPYDEYTGGEFSPATTLCSGSDGRLLLFGTSSGDICIFNNDKRGELPPTVEAPTDEERAEYKKRNHNRLHPYYYSFAGHIPRYCARTVRDDCGIPHLTKSTVKHSAAVKFRNFGVGKITIEAGTDKSGYKELSELPASGIDFLELDFSNFSFENEEYTTRSIKEKEKGWIEKDYNFYSDSTLSPFGICTLAYRFTVKGRIKK